MAGARGASGTANGDVFIWQSVDLRTALPDGWQQEILGLCREAAQDQVIIPGSVTSRERETVGIPTHIVDGRRIARELPWLVRLYTGLIRAIGARIAGMPVSAAADILHGMRLQAQRGAQERYECHVDSNPLTCMLYVTDQPPGTGGELVVANRGDVRGREEVDADATRIHPVAGQALFFDARRHTHYVAPLTDPDGLRVAVPMAFYTADCPESQRPKDLDRHLGLPTGADNGGR